MTGLPEATTAADKAARDYCLCSSCGGRLFPRRPGMSPAGPDRGSGKGAGPARQCYICRGLSVNLRPFLESMLEGSSGYDFRTFAVGTQVKPSMVDRDDLVRSKFKLRGACGIKTEITRELSRRFSKKTKKTHDALDPDLTFTVNTRDGLCHIRTKAVILQGRYTKTERGLPQKQEPCGNCSGKGCMTCGLHGITGFESVEGKISELLFSKFGCTTIRFTWVGGEDRSSLVLGAGRPFFAKIQNPSKRRPRLARQIHLGPVVLHDCKILGGFPRAPMKFSSTVKIRISTENPLDPQALRKLKSGFCLPVAVYERSGKRSEKSISCVRYKKTSDCRFVLTIDAEGGLPIKRFVEGDDVAPGVSQILGDACRCVEFDFLRVGQ